MPLTEPEVYSIRQKRASTGFYAAREQFSHERRRNRDKQRAISAAIHFRGEKASGESKISLNVHSGSPRVQENDFRDRVQSVCDPRIDPFPFYL